MPTQRRLTRREWRAIREALTARLADAFDIDDDDAPRREEYESALAKVQERLQL